MVTTFPERVSLTAADGAGQILLETLEPRLLLSASPAEVISLKWCGQTVQAVADQWILGLADPQVSLADLQADLAGQALLPLTVPSLLRGEVQNLRPLPLMKQLSVQQHHQPMAAYTIRH